MKQVVQDVRGGLPDVREVPDPLAQPGEVLIATSASVVSAGTERYVVDLAGKSLMGKALARPDHVARIVSKFRQEGVASTLQQVRGKLAEPVPLGYSSAGTVLACGRGVQEFKPGDRVATAGPHAGIASVGRRLCARVPDGVTLEQAAYAGIGAVALQGIRLARISIGERVAVIGLGLLGQITICLLKAQGCRVFGVDIDQAKVDNAQALGIDLALSHYSLDALHSVTGPAGADAVIVTTATTSNEPIEFAATACRRKGRVVLVGVAGTTLPRQPFFEKELEFTVSSSLGPGRGDPQYEEHGIDYPIGHVRWTVQRNMETVLESIALGKIPTDKLTTHHFPVERAADAYSLILSKAESFTGIVLQYPVLPAERSARLDLIGRGRLAMAGDTLGVSVIGGGNFARLLLIPELSKQRNLMLRGVCTAKGLNAEQLGRQHSFAFASTDVTDVLNDASTGAVFIATRHHLHAGLAIAALKAGKHVFVEKPLCITASELRDISTCVDELGPEGPILTVGFNRRFAPATAMLREHFKHIRPLNIGYRFRTGRVDPASWPHDEDAGGGRIVGEACHAIDLCVGITGSPPVRIFAESVGRSEALVVTDDRVAITVRHQDGSVSAISYHAAGDPAGPGERIEIFGGGRTAIVEGWDAIELWADGKCSRSRGGKNRGHAAELEMFLAAWRDGGGWPIAWSDLHATTMASLMAVTSLREGIAVNLNDFAQL